MKRSKLLRKPTSSTAVGRLEQAACLRRLLSMTGPCAGQKAVGLQLGQPPQRLGRGSQPLVGPVVPVGGVRGPHLARTGQGAAAEKRQRAILALADREGQVGQGMTRTGDRLDGPAAPGDRLAVFQGTIDAGQSFRQHKVSGAGAAQGKRFLPVFLDALRREPGSSRFGRPHLDSLS